MSRHRLDARDSGCKRHLTHHSPLLTIVNHYPLTNNHCQPFCIKLCKLPVVALVNLPSLYHSHRESMNQPTHHRFALPPRQSPTAKLGRPDTAQKLATLATDSEGGEQLAAPRCRYDSWFSKVNFHRSVMKVQDSQENGLQ